jgi:hypothetical protein
MAAGSAIAELQKIHHCNAFAKATVEAGKGVIQGAQQLIENPVATIGAAPEAVFRIFDRVSEAAKRGGRGGFTDRLTRLDFLILDELGYLPFACPIRRPAPVPPGRPAL